ncbi:unnamed protein product [Amoebophrya sp. A25]|nr:unnamed protein product [Amoebophrya sp. A25]|eukprot:GSA25T00018948001.1
MSGLADILERDDEARSTMMGEFHPQKYQGLIKHIGQIKKNIATDKRQFEENEHALRKQIEKQEITAKVVQKQLSTQVEITNRGYASLLTQMQGKTEECKNLEEKVRLLTSEMELKQRESAVELKKHQVEMKQRIDEKELEIKALQRSIADHKHASAVTERELQKKIQDAEYIVDRKEEGLQRLIDDNTKLEQLVEAEKNRAEGIRADAEKRVHEFEERTKVVQFSYKEKCEENDRLEQIIAEKDQEIRGLTNRDSDFDPEKDKKAALAEQKEEFDELLKKKEEGFQHLIEDFSLMDKKKSEELTLLKESTLQMRQQLEEEMKLTKLELVTKQTLLDEQIKEGAEERAFWLDKYEKLEAVEAEAREGFKRKIRALEEERDVAVEAMSKLKEYTDDVKQREATRKDEKSGEVATLMHKIRRLEQLIKDTNVQAEEAVKKKDGEVQRYMAQIAKLQEQITVAKKRERDIDFMWEERMREKEIGAGKLLKELSELKEEFVFAEQKVTEAQAKQEAAQKKMRLIEAQLAEEIKQKEAEIVRLGGVIQKLKEEVQREIQRQKEIEELWKRRLAEAEERERLALEAKDEQIMELKALQKKLEKTIQDRIAELNDLREELDDLGTEMEEEIQSRDRIIDGLRNEITALKEMYEEMLEGLRAEYAKLKKTYDEEVGEGGVQEQKQKAERLEKDMAALREVVDQLKQKIIELKAIIREKDLEQDELQKETMDLLFIKETAYKKLAAENAEMSDQLEQWEYKLKEAEMKGQKDAFKMKKYFDRQLAAKDFTIGERDKTIEKNKEWLVEIDRWKKENEKRRDEMAQMERDTEEKIRQKEVGMQYLVDEVKELRGDLQKQEEAYEQKTAAREKEVRDLVYTKEEEYKALERDTIQLRSDYNQCKLDLAAAIADGQKVDPEKVRLQKLAEDNALTIAESKRAIDVMTKENENERKRSREVEEQCARDIKRAKKSEETEVKRREHAERELKLVKEMCEEQMVKAELICKQIEERYRALPNPFADEVVEVRERVEQQKAGIENLRLENDTLVRELQLKTKQFAEDKLELEKKLVYATTVLNEVSSLGAIRGLAGFDENEVLGASGAGSPRGGKGLLGGEKNGLPGSPKKGNKLSGGGGGGGFSPADAPGEGKQEKKKKKAEKKVQVLPTVDEETRSEAADTGKS